MRHEDRYSICVLQHACSLPGVSVQTIWNVLYIIWINVVIDSVWVRILSWFLPAAIFPFVDWLPLLIQISCGATESFPYMDLGGFWLVSHVLFFFLFGYFCRIFIFSPLHSMFIQLYVLLLPLHLFFGALNIFFPLSANYTLQICDSLLLSLYLLSLNTTKIAIIQPHCCIKNRMLQFGYIPPKSPIRYFRYLPIRQQPPSAPQAWHSLVMWWSFVRFFPGFKRKKPTHPLKPVLLAAPAPQPPLPFILQTLQNQQRRCVWFMTGLSFSWPLTLWEWGLFDTNLRILSLCAWAHSKKK